MNRTYKPGLLFSTNTSAFRWNGTLLHNGTLTLNVLRPLLIAHFKREVYSNSYATTIVIVSRNYQQNIYLSWQLVQIPWELHQEWSVTAT